MNIEKHQNRKRPPDSLLIAFSLLGMAMGVMFVFEFLDSRPEDGARLTNGIVVSSAYTTHIGFKRPVLTVRLENSEETVRAVLANDKVEDFPQRVSFYYSGDPKKEVFIQEEMHPLWGLLLCSVCVFVFIGIFLYYRYKHCHPSAWEKTMTGLDDDTVEEE